MKYLKAYELDGSPVLLPVSRILIIYAEVRKKVPGCWIYVSVDRINANDVVDEFEYRVSHHDSLAEADAAINGILDQLNGVANG